MACGECERLDKVEIECARRASSAQSLLQSFSPEPPFGETAANQLRMFENAAEQSRASLDRAKRERALHDESHAMTLSR